jgi:ParB family chromosome partitioning protein
VSKGKLTNYTPQKRNANKHTQRGLGALETSIQKDGWIGAITVAADGETFDGSARIEVGAATGFDDVIVVESDGTKPIVHRRIDIPTADDPRAVRLGYAANRVAALNLDFDPAVILADLDAGMDLSALWNEGELEALVKATTQAGDAEWGAALGGLPSGDKAPFQQMTFTVSDEQAEQVKMALDTSKHMGPFVDTGNENSNGNALARICETFLNGR